MDFQNDIFSETTFQDMTPKRTGYYYAYDLIVEGLRAYCKALGVEPKWHDGYDSIVEWLRDSKGKGLLVYGDQGCGKSLLCANVIYKIIKHDYNSCSYYDAYQLAHIGTEDLSMYSFTCIDDVGVEEDYNQYGTKRSIFREVVNYAEQHGTVLILTSNLTLKQLEEKYGSRTVDRLRALVKPVIIKGASMRNGDMGDGYPIPERHRAYGIDFDTEKEAQDFYDEQRLLREYISYKCDEIKIYPPDTDAWNENQPFRIYKKTAFAIMNYKKEEWDKRDWKNDPDRLEYLKADFY